jgi:hypothetical protein
MIVAKDKEAEWRKLNNLVEEYIATVVGPLPAEVAADIEPTPVIDHRRGLSGDMKNSYDRLQARQPSGGASAEYVRMNGRRSLGRRSGRQRECDG